MSQVLPAQGSGETGTQSTGRARDESVGASQVKRRWVVSITSVAAGGLLLAVSFPPRPWWWLAPVAFALLGLALRGRRARAGAGYGFVFGLAFFLPHLFWIQDFLGAELGPVPWLALSTVMAAFVAAACALLPLVGRLPAAPLWMALVFLAQEAVRSRFPFNGFPWGRVAFGQVDGPFLSLGSIGGAPLVGFAVLLTGFGLAALIAHVHEHGLRPSPAWCTPVSAALVPVIAALLVWPTVGTEPQDGTRTVAVVQGNAPNIGLGLLGQRSTLRRHHLQASQELATRIRSGALPRPDLVVWPETATEITGPDQAIDNIVADLGAPTLIGALYQPPTGSSQNAVIAWDPHTGQGQRYAKQELVPFAEYIPLRSIAALFTPFADTTDLTAGTRPGVLDIADTTVGIAICYEAAYDHVSREATNQGAQLLVVPTNNAWYGRGEMTYQQLAMSRLRAVEHGRAVIVAATSGVSAIIRPDGSLAQITDMFTTASLIEDVPLRHTTTLADRLGPWTERGLTILAVVGILAAAHSHQRPRHVGEISSDDATS
ncbi:MULTISPECIES: apolipoprotein N-acyltransferase [Saccharomonospora]|uniref:Apolipoprotein N-acyltransferase n=3 Tax=Saccharomonospora TaxID=1851 RepID=I1D4J9_9PSEU|nr:MULTISPECIES: apolipoprotein N-acyltransferase [Saccharomonospora]EHR61522.1 apolipoprotein N-acyltransferase [Saccharomonospora cyanea NA-134]EHY87420.1 apolipoprotein N-acyltransferase [Saccharomonospora azurea NA-128]EIE99873.1 apolipoprotein N-acyltransferase [Saccharomonospora glauca K62]